MLVQPAPVVVESVVTDLDTIVRRSRFSGWPSSQPGDRRVRIEIRGVIKKYALPLSGDLFDRGGDLFDRAYAYTRENY
jgi:type I restriction enzyme R subunit